MPVRGQYIVFNGSLTGNIKGKPTVEGNTVEVLAGEGAPTVTGGWPEWLTIPRPQRVGMTVLQGYPPVKLSIPIRFEALLASEQTRNGRAYDIEREIQKLEWMAGRGRPGVGGGDPHPKPGGTFQGIPGHDALGDSPIVEVTTTDGSRMIPLIPVQFQTLPYVIDGEAGGITWDTNPLRDEGGGRLRQLGTVYLKQFVAAPGTSADSAATRANVRNAGAGRGETVHSTAVLNTVKRLVIHYGHGSTAGVRETIEANRKFNTAIGSDADKPLRSGTRVFIPYNVTHRLSSG